VLVERGQQVSALAGVEEVAGDGMGGIVRVGEDVGEDGVEVELVAESWCGLQLEGMLRAADEPGAEFAEEIVAGGVGEGGGRNREVVVEVTADLVMLVGDAFRSDAARG